MCLSCKNGKNIKSLNKALAYKAQYDTYCAGAEVDMGFGYLHIAESAFVFAVAKLKRRRASFTIALSLFVYFRRINISASQTPYAMQSMETSRFGSSTGAAGWENPNYSGTDTTT